MPLEERPQFISIYLPEIDQAGHRSGPDSPEVIDRLRYADNFAQSIFDEINKRNLADIVNIIFGKRNKTKLEIPLRFFFS